MVNLTSASHMMAPKCGINLDDLIIRDADSPWARYGQSNLANVLLTHTLNKMYGPGTAGMRDGGSENWVESVHPGVAITNLSSKVDKVASGGMKVVAILRMLGLAHTADKGSWTSLFCVASPDMKVEQSGSHMEITGRFGKPWWQSDLAKDAKLVDKLEQWTNDAMTKGGWSR